VQHLLGQGDAAAALEILQDESIGPLTLVEAKAAAASEPRFVMETYKTALRAYLYAQPPNREQAQQIMTALDDAAAKLGAAGAEQLTRVYASLGLQLQRQLKQFRDTGQDARAAEVEAAFRDVMDRVAAQPSGGNWTIAKWVADTNLQLGQGLEAKEAKPYLDRAKASYESVLAAAKQGGAGAPDAETTLIAHKRLGDCLIALGDYKPALDQYAAALRAKPMMLDVQQAAAAGLQQWGVAKRVPKALDEAIQGALPQAGKNLIWGWAKLAQIADNAKRQASQAAATNPDMAERAARYEEVFFEARYNIAKARFQAALIAPPAEKQEHLIKARQNIEAMKQLFPELGGARWKAEFEKLLDDINKQLGK
jgi:tetratricopeptide (TPR) repeat protein